METYQDAEDKITTALLLLAAAAEIINDEIATRHHHDKTAFEAQCEKRIFQIHAAVTFLAGETEVKEDLFPDPKTLKFYPEPDASKVTE